MCEIVIAISVNIFPKFTSFLLGQMNCQYFKYSRALGLWRLQCSFQIKVTGGQHTQGRQVRQTLEESRMGWSQCVQNYLLAFKIILKHKIPSFYPCLLWPNHSGNLHRTKTFLLNFNHWFFFLPHLHTEVSVSSLFLSMCKAHIEL